MLAAIPCCIHIRCCQSSVGRALLLPTGSLALLPPNPPLPLHWMPSALKLPWEWGAPRGGREGCLPAVHHPSSWGQMQKPQPTPAFSPGVVFPNSFRTSLAAPNFSCFSFSPCPPSHLTGRLAGNQHPGEPVWAESDPSLLTSVLQFPLLRCGVMGQPACISENIVGRVKEGT